MNWREYDLVVLNPELSPLHARLYCYLRRNMDINSGVVGDADKKLISYQAIRENLEYHPKARSNERPLKVSRDQVKRMLERLVEVGAIRRLKGQRYGRELRFFLTYATTESVCNEYARPMRATDARHTLSTDARHAESRVDTGNCPDARPEKEVGRAYSGFSDARHTSDIITLSQNNYKYYSPDDDDWAWLRYQKIDLGNGRGEIDVGMETEKFNLKYSGAEDYDMSRQRADWRMWMLRAVEFRAEKRNQGW